MNEAIATLGDTAVGKARIVVALVPVIEGMELDLVTIKGRNGVLNAERIVSFEVQRGELIEVSARTIELRDLP